MSIKEGVLSLQEVKVLRIQIASLINRISFFALLILMMISSVFFTTHLQAGTGASFQPEEQWFSLYISGKKSGYSKIERLLENNHVVTTVTTFMQISRAGTQLTMENFEQSVETITGQAVSFSARDKQGVREVNISGTVAGNVVDIEVDNAGIVNKMQQPWDETTLLYEGQRLKALEMAVSKQAQYNMNTYMISSLKPVVVKTQVGKKQEIDIFGKKYLLTEALQTLVIGNAMLKMTNYIDDKADAKKMSMPMMGSIMELVASTQQQALSPNEISNFFASTLIRSPAVIPNEQIHKPLTFNITPKNDQIQFGVSNEQRVTQLGNGDIQLTISPLMSVAANAQTHIPYQGTDQKIVKYLKANMWVQNNNQKLISLAKNAIGKSTLMGEVAKKLEVYTRAYISEKNLNVGYATALEVMKTKEGDCTEHALLLTAFLKAVGIPARVATGIVYADDFDKQQKLFIPHAWSQAYIDGRWQSFDAALNGFDSTHILFSYGDGEPMGFFNIVNMIGNFDIRSVSNN